MYDSVLSNSPAVERVWVGDSIVEPGIGHRSDPVLGVDLVFTINGSSCQVILQGPVTARTVYPHRPDTEYVGVRFRPGVGVDCGHSSIAELHDDSVPVSSVAGVDLAPLVERLLDADGLVGRGDLVRQAIHASTISQQSLSPLVVAALERFDRGPASARVRTVAEDLGVTERSLQRHFKSHLGINPKTAARLVRVDRLQAAIDRRTSGPVDLAALALTAGYFDQSHMTNEVTRVLGTTPADLVDELRGGWAERSEMGG